MQRHKVGDRADGDDVDQGTQVQRQLDAILSLVLEQSVRELEGDADAGETGEGVAGQLGRDDDAGRELAGQLVMVGDDDVHAELLRQPHLLDRVDAAVDGDQQTHAVGRQLLDGGGHDTVPFGEAVGQPPAHVGAQALQDLDGRNVAVMPSAS